MADENTYMNAVKDRIGDLVHRGVNVFSGSVATPSAPNKPAASEQPASDWVSRRQQAAQSATNAGIDKAISDNGG